MEYSVQDTGTKEVITKVIKILWDNKSKIDEVCKVYVETDELMKVYRGDLKVISTYPCICVEPVSNTFTYAATNYAISSTFNIRIFCYIRNADREEWTSYIMDFSDVVKSILNDPDNVAWTSTDAGVIYNSTAGQVIFGFKQGQAIRAAQIDYVANGWNSAWYKND